MLLLLMFQVPAYAVCQIVGSILASGTLRLMMFRGNRYHFIGSAPGASDIEAFVMEFVLTFFLMFVVSAVATDNRAVSFFLINYCHYNKF